MKYLRPLPLKDQYFTGIEQEINKLFFKIIYSKLMVAIAEETGIEIRNANSWVADAMQTGVIWYQDAGFHGTFNARISKELRDAGATWNPKSKTFSLPWEQMPMQWRTAQAHAEMNYNVLREKLIKTLDDMDIESIDKISDTMNKYAQTVIWMNDDFEKTVKAIAIPPVLTGEQTKMIAAEWGQNLDIFVKNWSKLNILQMRKEIQTNAFGGQRSSALIKYIQDNYKVSQNKAKFLARQETSLLMSKFHQSRYADVGVTEYRWSTSHDKRVRHDHAELDGKIFAFAQPPVVDRSNGKRANPGEDFGCRCKARPIVR